MTSTSMDLNFVEKQKHVIYSCAQTMKNAVQGIKAAFVRMALFDIQLPVPVSLIRVTIMESALALQHVQIPFFKMDKLKQAVRARKAKSEME